jgi:cobalt/nickel transport protein
VSLRTRTSVRVNSDEMTTIKKLWIGIGILALLSPLGMIIPAWFGAGSAWGEWGLAEIKKLMGFIPEGMQKLAELWKSPMHDYTVPGQKQGLAHKSLGYILTALIGIAITSGLAYLIARLLGRKNKGD